jgi:hypothetical protein
MSNLQNVSLVFLVLFLIVATIDGLYFHLWKYKLFLRAESLYEHKLHTIRAFLFIPIVFFLFYANFGGIALWAGILFILLDLAVEMLDVLNENESRASLGGLTSLEYLAHISATTFRIAAISLVLAAKPSELWGLSAPIWTNSENPTSTFIALNVISGNLLVGILHLLLMNKTFRNFQVFSCCR